MKFEDHFSKHAHTYAQYRPEYPPELYTYLSSLTSEHRLAWDCATGNGQAARGLVDTYDLVIASDASEEQIQQAAPHPRIVYRVEPAEETSLEPASVDLVTVAVAVHWFDFNRFYQEVWRVLKPAGVIAVWTYQRAIISPAVDRVIAKLDDEILADYWPERVRYLKELYRTLPFPFAEIQAPDFEMKPDWSLEQLLGFINSWSGVRRFEEREGVHPLQSIWEELNAAWGSEKEVRTVRFPLLMRIGKTER